MNFINLFPMHSTHIKFSVKLSYVVSALWLQRRLKKFTNRRSGFGRMKRAGVGVNEDRTWSGCPRGISAPSGSLIKSNNTGLAGTAKNMWEKLVPGSLKCERTHGFAKCIFRDMYQSTRADCFASTYSTLSWQVRSCCVKSSWSAHSLLHLREHSLHVNKRPLE